MNYAKPLPVVHASSSKEYAGYIEDAFASCSPKPLHAGAVNLLQNALRLALEHFPDAAYLVHLESDTWLLDETLIQRYVEQMDATGALLATCAWSTPGGSKLRRLANLVSLITGAPRFPNRRQHPMSDLSTQFFIVRNRDDVLATIFGLDQDAHVNAEKAFFDAYFRSFPLSTLLRMEEREPVEPFNRYWCEPQALYCQHWPARDTAKDPRHWTNPLYVRRRYDGKRDRCSDSPKCVEASI